MTSFRESASRFGALTLPPMAVPCHWDVVYLPAILDHVTAVDSLLESTGVGSRSDTRLSLHLPHRRGAVSPRVGRLELVQWRLPGAPGSMLAPNLLGVFRLAPLVSGMTMSAWLLVRRYGRHRLEQATVCSLPAVVVVTVPAFAEDLARF